MPGDKKNTYTVKKQAIGKRRQAQVTRKNGSRLSSRTWRVEVNFIPPKFLRNLSRGDFAKSKEAS